MRGAGCGQAIDVVRGSFCHLLYFITLRTAQSTAVDMGSTMILPTSYIYAKFFEKQVQLVNLQMKLG